MNSAMAADSYFNKGGRSATAQEHVLVIRDDSPGPKNDQDGPPDLKAQNSTKKGGYRSRIAMNNDLHSNENGS